MGKGRGLAVLFSGVLSLSCGEDRSARCAAGTALHDGVCEGNETHLLAPFCGEGTVKVGNACVLAPRAETDAAPVFAGLTSAETVGDDSVLLQWGPATDDHTPSSALSYELAWGTTDDFTADWTNAIRTPPGFTEQVVTGLPKPGTQYFFRARALDGAGRPSAPSDTVTAKTGPDVHGPDFAGCTGAVGGPAQIDVSWSAATDAGTAAGDIVYDVWLVRGTDAGDVRGRSPDGTVIGDTRLSISGIASDTSFSVVCHASDAAGNRDDNTVVLDATTDPDTAKPDFGGVTTVTDGTAAGSLVASWNAATDGITATADVRYAVYVASSSGGEDFTAPALVTKPGELGATITGLSKFTTTYVVVRAIDRAGNEDDNVVEKSVTEVIGFARDIEPMLAEKCALISCHTAQDPNIPPKQGMNLDIGSAYLSTVNVTAVEGQSIGEPNVVRIATTGVPTDSYLWRTISGQGAQFGSPMGEGLGGSAPLTGFDLDIIRTWLERKAPND